MIDLFREAFNGTAITSVTLSTTIIQLGGQAFSKGTKVTMGTNEYTL